jgi:glycine hydroxymethyltransferase
MMNMNLHTQDPDIYNLIQKETNRQADGLEMIPSENHTSPAVIEALGSRLTDKYSEGYPGARYYGGCEFVDEIENIARDRAKQLFGCTHANVQAHSGGPANMAAYVALMEPGETLLGMKLFHGGHMTHGLKVNYSGRFYNSVQYGCTLDGYIDLDEVRRLAHEHKPKVIVSGGSAYPRQYPWAAFSDIAAEVGAFHLADMSHVGGLVAGGAHPSPIGLADIVTTTTHKTLRGPRGAIILANGNPSTPLTSVERTKENIPTLIDRAIIPGLQGGPHNNQTAGIAIALKEALQPEFKVYAAQVIKNAQVLADELMARGYRLITGGTDTHLLLIDLTEKQLTGQQGVDALSRAGITVNKNTFAGDPRKPFDPSGIRMGTPALTTRGMKEAEMKIVADCIDRAITHHTDDAILSEVRNDVIGLTKQFPLYRGLA